jgi:hypothetical protein
MKTSRWSGKNELEWRAGIIPKAYFTSDGAVATLETFFKRLRVL